MAGFPEQIGIGNQAGPRWIYEHYANQQFFFNRPIVPPSIEGLPSWMQATPQTSRSMKALGKATSKLPESLGGGLGGGLSPARMEHLLRAYFNAWAMYGLTLADQVFFDDSPAMRPDEVPGLRAVYRGRVSRSSRYQAMYYDMLREATKIRRGMRKMDRDYRPEIADEMEQMPEILVYGQLTKVRDNIQAINADMNRITAAHTLAQVREIANQLGQEKDLASSIGRVRLSKSWRDTGLLKRDMRDVLCSERNAAFKAVVKDIEAQRKQRRKAP